MPSGFVVPFLVVLLNNKIAVVLIAISKTAAAATRHQRIEITRTFSSRRYNDSLLGKTIGVGCNFARDNKRSSFSATGVVATKFSTSAVSCSVSSLSI